MTARLAAVTALLLITDDALAQRPTPEPFKAGRSVTLATHGMVATSHPLAAQIGLDVLKAGGNAVDAALATSAAMGLLEPMSCGIGGDLFAIVWDAKTQKLHGLNACGAAPGETSIELYRRKGLAEIPEKGPLSWSVPGCVDGWDQLRQKFGTKSFRELMAPSIRYAEEGAPVPEVIAGYWAKAEENKDPEFRQVYTPGRKAPRVGEVFRNPALAKTYGMIADLGRDAFYRGDVMHRLVNFSRRKGGLFAAADFEAHRSEWVEPVSTTYRGVQVWELPPPGQGIAVLQMLNLLEGSDLRTLGPTSPDYWHLLIEAKKLAYADRARYYADPLFARVPFRELISKNYAAARRPRIDPAKAATDVPPGDPKLGKADTIYLCVVDKDRNCVSLIQSNYFGFGSGLAAADLGFAIQNRGCLFALDPAHPNALAPGKRPFHTIIPAMATKGGRPWLTFGVMGGDMQPQGQVQVLVNLLDFGMNLQQAGEAPRVEHVGHATPTGRPAAPGGGTVKAEYGIPDAVVAELVRRGHQVERVRTNGGGYQAIMIDPAAGVLHGATEARKDGAAVGY